MKKRINKFIENDLNSQYQTNIKIENILNDLDVDANSEEVVNYYKKRMNFYLKFSKAVFATCLTCILIIVSMFMVKQNQLLKHNNKFIENTLMAEHGLLDDEFNKLISEGNRILREPICFIQLTNNIYIYVYYGKDYKTTDYYILVHFLQNPNHPLKVIVNQKEVMCTTTRKFVHALKLDLTQVGIVDCLDFVIDYNNSLRRYIVYPPII